MSFLINKSFPIGNMAFIIRIPMGFDPAPFWIKIFLSFFYLSKKVISNETFRRYKYHEVSRLIDNLCAINDRNQFLTTFKNIYSNELQLKVKHQGNLRSILDLDMKTDDSVFVYKLFDKRDNFSFFIVRMSHLSSNIPCTFFGGSILSERLQIARHTRKINYFIPRASDLFSRMIAKDGNRATRT